ncbi:MAG TPA: Lrp/AsnC ligand binding domain-containing protein [Actinomycetota bacterium]|nr:Lrp/AsnC ligand binding domain-containing protein [Actinomycetota bacterium]
MSQTYVLVEVEPGAIDRVLDELVLLPGVAEATCVVGGFDLIIRAEVADEALSASLRAHIASMRGVTRALPCEVRREPVGVASAL